MKKTSKRLAVSILTMILTVVALGTTTFAWFTLSNVSTLGNINGEIMAGEGLQFKVIAKGSSNDTIAETEFKSHIDFDNEQEFNNFFDSFVFRAVELNTEATKLEQLGVSTDGKLFRGEDTVKNKDYIELEFVFRGLTKNATVYMTNFTVVNGNIRTFKTGSTFTSVTGNKVQADETLSVNGKDAIRFGLVGATDEITPYFSGHTVDKDYGQWEYLQSIEVDIYEDNNLETKVKETPALPSKKFPVSTDHKTRVEVAKLTEAEEGDAGTGILHYTGNATIKIWVDGWDPHAFDAIFQQTVNISLAFELATP